MSYTYLANLRGGVCLGMGTYSYPSYDHPHAEFLPKDAIQGASTLLVKILIGQIDLRVFMEGKQSVAEFVKNKQGELIFHGVTADHVELLDHLYEQMRKNTVSFLRPGAKAPLDL